MQHINKTFISLLAVSLFCIGYAINATINGATVAPYIGLLGIGLIAATTKYGANLIPFKHHMGDRRKMRVPVSMERRRTFM